MRKKNDTLIKWFQLANTMYLTNEEFGAIVRQVMIADDAEGLRYKHLNEEAKEDLREAEQEWKEEYEKLKIRNPFIIAGFNSLSYQVNSSTDAFFALKERLNKKNLDGTTDNETQKKKPIKIEQLNIKDFKINSGDLIIEFKTSETEHPEFFPNIEDLEEYIERLKEQETEESIITAILDELAAIGNQNKWEKHWMLYRKQIEDEQLF